MQHARFCDGLTDVTLRRQIRRWQPIIDRRMQRAAIRAVDDGVKVAKQQSPVLTGALRRSIHRDKLTITSNLPYAYRANNAIRAGYQTAIRQLRRRPFGR